MWKTRWAGLGIIPKKVGLRRRRRMRSRRIRVIRLHPRSAVSAVKAASTTYKGDNGQLVQDKLTQGVETSGGRHREVIYW